MKLSEPIGNQAWAPFFIRVALGSWLVLAGLAKLDDLPGFVQQVKQLKILPDHLATLYALSLPYLEVAIGSLLVVGIWSTLSAILASLLVASFLYFFGIFPGRGMLFNKDVLLFAGAVSLLFSGAGAVSIDKFRKGAS